ncbi:MAG TPA: extracellular solute-binding protein [Bifidobacterium pullorum]|nr:extracellular solute-binding protein [Bifidobacterium pullorum]
MADILAQWRDAGYFNIDYSSATFDDLARRMAQNELAFLFNANGGAQNVLAYNPDAKLGFMPYPSAVGDPYLITGEDYALGVSKDSAAKENALKFIDFMAEPEHMQVFNAVVNNAPALTTIEPEMGVVQSSYDKWVTEENTGTTLIFDRVHLPNGMWNTLITTTDSIINGQVSSEDAAQQMETSFISLYRRKS